jgi:hypothetical protein
MSDELNKKFNIIPRADPVNAIETIKDDINIDSAIKDFGTARANILSVLNSGSAAVGELADMSFSSQDPEHYAALASMIKAVTGASEKLLVLHKKIEEIKDKNNNKSGDNPTVHNHLHLTTPASTQELAQALKQIRNN